MNAEQQQRALQMLRRFERAVPMTRQAENAAVDMAALLRELVAEQPTSVPVLTVECEPDYWSGGHYHEGTLPHIDPTAVWKLPIGTKLYTAPAAPEPEPFVWWSDADDVVFQSLHNGKHLPFDQRDAYLSAVEISSAIPLYTTPPAPSVPEGWGLVPEKPAVDMIVDGLNASYIGGGCNEGTMARRMYTALLAAAPEAPAVQETWSAEQCAQVLRALRYIQGIAERGEGRPMRDNESLEEFLLGYVQRLERKAQAVQVDQSEQHLEMVKRDLFQARQALWNEGQQRDKLLAALELIMERMELPPDTDCYCHISPPCHDCVENSGIREAIELAESTLAEVRGGE